MGCIVILRRALDTGEGIADRELVVRPLGAPRDARILDVTITPLAGQITGTHLLLELADTTQRQRIIARKRSARAARRQPAHDQTAGARDQKSAGRVARRGPAIGA